jgi:WXG100 family type VII secretion target
VATAKLMQVANNLENIIREYHNNVEKFYNCGAEIDQMWDGDANNKFVYILANDRARFNAMKTILQQYVDVLRRDASAYEKAEVDVLNTLATNKIR